MAYRRSSRKKRTISKPKVCRFCKDSSLKIDYKDGKFINRFITERGKILPRRISGNCSRHQREITTAIKRARVLALIPYTAIQLPDLK